MEEIKRSGLTLDQAKMLADMAIADVKNGFVSTGYYLKAIRDEKLWREQGYTSFDAFLNVNYEKDKSWASRCVSLYEKFGIEVSPGELPRLDPEYINYNVSQLIEMISLSEEKRELVTPETPVRAIRELKPKREKKVETVATFEPEEKQEVEPDKEQNQDFITTPIGCSYRTAYSCTIPVENRVVPGDEFNCGSSCCWSCKFHGACKLECNASAGRDGTVPEYDAAWSVRKWAEVVPEELERALKACRENSTNTDRAKAVQKEISPYGAHSRSCWEYDFSFHGFAGGIDFRIGKVETHLKYGRFVQELMNLYPDFIKPVGEESNNITEMPENKSDQPEDVSNFQEDIIDGECVEVSSEPETIEYAPRYFLEEQKRKLDEYLRLLEKVELGPADIKLLERQKTIVCALAAMVAKLEAPEPAKQEQPELPILKNNDQRAAFVDAYESWPLWIETEETGERYYRYDLPDGTSMVVKVYHAEIFDYKATSVKFEDRYHEGYGKHEYYYLRKEKFFRDCETNRSYLIEKLKELQKKGKGDQDGKSE